MEVCKKNKCTGCGVCADACPQGCIEICYDENGFLYSAVDESKCIRCGKCSRVCPGNHPDPGQPVRKTYKASRKDTAAILNSTSGGMAALLSEHIVKNGGVVCGCGFDEGVLKHTVEDTLPGLEKFKGSKYIQSNTTGVFSQVRQQLQEGKTLLFAGTPCQISGLKNFLGKPYDNLYTVDLICHGVASTGILQRYAQIYETEAQQFTGAVFRGKKDGYIESQKNDLVLQYTGKTQVIDHRKGIVLWFASGLSLRKSCYDCSFVSTNRCGDLTLADYIGKDLSEQQKKTGASMVFVNTEKGQRLLNDVASAAELEEIPLSDGLFRYARLHQKRQPPKARKAFFRDLHRLSLKEMEEKYTLKKILPGKLSLYAAAAVKKIKGIIKVK